MPENTLSKLERAFKSYFSIRRSSFWPLEARLHFPRLVFGGGSYFGSDKDPSKTFFGSTFAYIYVMLVLKWLSLIVL